MLINRNQQFEEQLLLGELQILHSQFARHAGAAEDGVWKRKMNLSAAGVTRPRCVLPSSPPLHQRSLSPQQPSPVVPRMPLAPPPDTPLVAPSDSGSRVTLLSPFVWQQPPASGGKAQRAAGNFAFSPGTVFILTSHPFYAEGALETPASASEEQSFIMNYSSQLAEASWHHACVLPNTSKAQVPISCH